MSDVWANIKKHRTARDSQRCQEISDLKAEIERLRAERDIAISCLRGEREACAKVADSVAKEINAMPDLITAEKIAQAIRSRNDD